jgi:hypothetical protein
MNFNMTDIRLIDIHTVLDNITLDIYHVIYMRKSFASLHIVFHIRCLNHVIAIRYSQLF